MSGQRRWPGWLSDLLEWLLIGLWALWVGRAYLDFNPALVPTGREVGMAIQPALIWTLLPRCGVCVLWNGFVNGGYPAFAELHAAVLHPLVVLTTWLWGGINGTKVTLLACLALGGVAQWWLAKVLHLGLIPRLWSAALAVTGAHLGGRIEHGTVSLVISTATCSLVFPPALALLLTGRRRAAVLLGVMGALALLSGQGYLQLGLAVSLAPALLAWLLWPGSPSAVADPFPLAARRTVGKGLLLAGLLAGLLSGIFWVPLAHFWLQIVKDVDPTFRSVQPLGYALLNLVIHDPGFYYTESLGRWRYPYLYTTYIGWLPVLLGVLPLRFARQNAWRLFLFFWLIIGLLYLAGTAWTWRALALVWPELAAGIRYPSPIIGLAVPLLLGLAAWGLDWLLRRLPRSPWPLFWASLGLAAALLASLESVYRFTSTWLTVAPRPAETSTLLPWLTTSRGWVSLPYGEHFWTPLLAEAGVKMSPVARPWRWKDREPPAPYLVASRTLTETVPGLWGRVAGLALVFQPEHEYATVNLADVQVPCQATATGGALEVFCQTAAPGLLQVRENAWTGWRAWRDGEAVPLVAGPWLSVVAPAGSHHYRFRYWPWDVPLGAALTLVGLVLTAWLWRTPVAASAVLRALDRRLDGLLAAWQRGSLARRAWRVLCWVCADESTLTWAVQHRYRLVVALGLSGSALAALLGIVGLRLRPDFDPAGWPARFLVALFVLTAFVAGVFWHHEPS